MSLFPRVSLSPKDAVILIPRDAAPLSPGLLCPLSRWDAGPQFPKDTVPLSPKDAVPWQQQQCEGRVQAGLWEQPGAALAALGYFVLPPGAVSASGMGAQRPGRASAGRVNLPVLPGLCSEPSAPRFAPLVPRPGVSSSI